MKTLFFSEKRSVWSNFLLTCKVRRFMLIALSLFFMFTGQTQTYSVILKADNDQLLGRCGGCYPKANGKYYNSATVHIPYAGANSSIYARFKLNRLSNGKYTFQADNDNYLGRCAGCIPNSAEYNNLMIHINTESSQFAQFSILKTKNGKYVLQADNGLYVGRCNKCVPYPDEAKKPNSAMIHVQESAIENSEIAHWDIIDMSTNKSINLDVPSIESKLLQNIKAKKVISFTFKNGRTFKKIADRVWVEMAPGGKDYVGIYEELEIVFGKIKIHDYDRGQRYELNIAERRLESYRNPMPGAVSDIEFKDNMGFYELHRIKLFGKTLFAYTKTNKYGGSEHTPSCSAGDPTYRDVFWPACEKHDQYYRAPWYESGITYGKSISDAIFYKDMTRICHDAEGVIVDVSICKEAAWGWNLGLAVTNEFETAQSEEKNRGSASIDYIMPKKRLTPILDKFQKTLIHIQNKNITTIALFEKAISDLSVGDHYKFWIDFKGTGEDDYETESLITVELFDEYDLSLGYITSHGVAGTFKNSKKMSIFTERKPAYFVISNLGDDAFYIDRLILYKNGEEILSHGIDDGSGWCICNTSKIINEAEKGTVKCYKGIKFSATKVKKAVIAKDENIKKWGFEMKDIQDVTNK